MQASLLFDDRREPMAVLVTANDVCIDRGSRYGYAIGKATGKGELIAFVKSVNKTKPFVTADHNSYAYRLRSPEGILVEGKSDDGEAGAWLCILRELRRANVEQCVLLVSRHFGGIKLMNDRFKHVVDVAKMAIEQHATQQ